MTKLLQIYKCEVCGNIVEMIHEGAGQLVCCNEEMKLYEENTVDAAVEKHIPVYEKEGDIIEVSVGAVSHPMEEAHHIEWIELTDENGKAYMQFLKPGQKPEAQFCVKVPGKFTLREYCNLHGLWKS